MAVNNMRTAGRRAFFALLFAEYADGVAFSAEMDYTVP